MVLSLENVKHFLKMVIAAASIEVILVIYERDNDSIFAISDLNCFHNLDLSFHSD